MNIGIIDEAIDEAERFVLKAKRARARLYIDFEKAQRDLGLKNISRFSITSKETAACRRASMDLSRVLTNLRRR